MNATTAALSVLHQAAEGPELGIAAIEPHGTAVDLVNMRRTIQMRVQRSKGAERPVAQHTLVCRAIERPLGRVGLHDQGSLVRAVGPADEAAWVRDDPVAVDLHGEVVDLSARDARTARAGLEMLREIGVGDEGHVAAPPGARMRPLVVRSRSAEMSVQAMFVVEQTSARYAVPVLLPVVFVKPVLRVEDLAV